ncbi:hypothetical protein FDP41_010658 [Naegleria fowleri]|uniref:Uncharacterized protein n=1 Tax=Naegleria fowleri TaxID=5763 RepID=A0A6A5BZK7_NAEFO|nr:uncharacterized protein FDP41_010658 [Naegleria fowleri]KAF0983593.1 hypothetical protein FDP41_010658 [Naegleria fowleri]CAG4712168.1 unnamed protein product [Naegleria fowleri]
MPRKREEEESSEEETSEESASEEEEEDSEGSGSEEEGDEEEDEEDETGSEHSGSDDDEDDEESDEDSFTKKKKGVLNVSLKIDKENGKILSSKVREEEDKSPASDILGKTSTTTQTDYNMFFPPLAEALYQASTSSEKKEELIGQARKILLAPPENYRNGGVTFSSPFVQSQVSTVYQPVTSPFRQLNSVQTQQPNYYQQRYEPSDTYGSNFKPMQPMYYPPPPRNLYSPYHNDYQQSPLSNYKNTFQEQQNSPSKNHTNHLYRSKHFVTSPVNHDHKTFRPIQSPTLSINNNEDARFGRYVNEREFQKR